MTSITHRSKAKSARRSARAVRVPSMKRRSSRKSRRRSQKKHRTLHGGKAIATGSSGCVFEPPLTCSDGQTVPRNYVSKLSLSGTMDKEYTLNNFIKQRIQDIPNYNDYFIFFDIQCKPAPLTQDDRIQFEEICGNTLQNLQRNAQNDRITSENINKKLDLLSTIHGMNGGLPLEAYVMRLIHEKLDFNAFHISMIRLLRNGIVMLNDNNILHGDIKLDNVVIQKDTRNNTIHLRLIDWGRAIDTKDNIEIFKNKDNQLFTLIQQPLTYSLMCRQAYRILDSNQSMKSKKDALLIILNSEVSSPHWQNEQKTEAFGGFTGSEPKKPNSQWRADQLNGILNKYYNRTTMKFNWVEYSKLLRANYDVYGWLCLLNLCWRKYERVFNDPRSYTAFYNNARNFIKKYMYTLNVLLNPYDINTLIREFVHLTGIPNDMEFSIRTLPITQRNMQSRMPEMTLPLPITQQNMQSRMPEMPVNTLYFHTNENIANKKKTFNPNNKEGNSDYTWADRKNRRSINCYKCRSRSCPDISCLTLPLCMGHVNSLFDLKIKSITLNGHNIKSLFATKQFKAGEFIMPYIAEVITQATYDNRYSREEGGAYYVFHDANNIIYDSSSIRGVASWANRTSASRDANATLKSYRNAYPNVFAIKDINIDDEISIHAGDGRFDVVDPHARIYMFDTECEQCPQEYVGEF